MNVLAIIPARAGSKGLPGKNVRIFCGLPLAAHAVRCAWKVPEVEHVVVSSDSRDVLWSVFKKGGGGLRKPILQERPMTLSQDDTPIWPVVRHALDEQESLALESYDYVLLLEPTSPLRRPEDIQRALHMLDRLPGADGMIAVAPAHFNPLWNAFYLRDAVEPMGYQWLEEALPEAVRVTRRQEVPQVYHHSGAFYIWRASFVREHEGDTYRDGVYLGYETDQREAFSIDTLEDFEFCEQLVKAGIVRLPWLS